MIYTIRVILEIEAPSRERAEEIAGEFLAEHVGLYCEGLAYSEEIVTTQVDTNSVAS